MLKHISDPRAFHIRHIGIFVFQSGYVNYKNNIAYLIAPKFYKEITWNTSFNTLGKDES